MRTAPVIELSEYEREVLLRWRRDRATPARLSLRAGIVLLAAEGLLNKDIATRLRVDPSVVSRWRSRFATRGIAGIEKEAGGRGRRPTTRRRLTERVLQLTLRERPKTGGNWTTRILAEELGAGRSTVHRIWQDNGLTPEIIRALRIARHPRFAAKLRGIAGIYMSPDEHGLVISLGGSEDAPSEDGPTTAGRATPPMFSDELVRIKQSWLATLSGVDRRLRTLAREERPPGPSAWLHFLKRVEAVTPEHADLHVVADNLRSSQRASIRAWQVHHPRFHWYMTPAGGPWFRLIDLWFSELTPGPLRAPFPQSIHTLQAAMEQFIQAPGETPPVFCATSPVGGATPEMPPT